MVDCFILGVDDASLVIHAGRETTSGRGGGSVHTRLPRPALLQLDTQSQGLDCLQAGWFFSRFYFAKEACPSRAARRSAFKVQQKRCRCQYAGRPLKLIKRFLLNTIVLQREKDCILLSGDAYVLASSSGRPRNWLSSFDPGLFNALLKRKLINMYVSRRSEIFSEKSKFDGPPFPCRICRRVREELLRENAATARCSLKLCTGNL